MAKKPKRQSSAVLDNDGSYLKGKLVDVPSAGEEETYGSRTASTANSKASSSMVSSLTTDANSNATSISRPSSAASMRVRVDKQTAESVQSSGPFTHVPNGYASDGDPSADGAELWVHRGGAPAYGKPTWYKYFKLQLNQLLANTLSSVFLILVVIWALSVRFFAYVPVLLGLAPKKEKEELHEWDDPKRWKKEKLVKDVGYYARSCGFDIVDETVETEDGFYLRVHRVIDPTRKDEKRKDGRGGFPILIQHGLFQSSGSFVTSEERSLAFWLARHGGYQVFLGNNRGVFDMGHKTLKRNDPRFWDWNIRELAIYELPAMVDFIRKDTGYDKVS